MNRNRLAISLLLLGVLSCTTTPTLPTPTEEVVVSPTPDLPDGVVAYYPLDGDANDASGNGHHGRAYGASWTDGIAGQALDLDGAGYVATLLRMSDVWNVGDPIHLSVWIRTTAMSGLALAGMPGGGPDFACAVRDGKAKVRLYGGTTVASDSEVNDGNWHNVSWGTDGTTTYFYVDGVRQSASPSIGDQNRETLMLGARRNPPTDHFAGVIDEVMIFHRALSVDEIRRLYDRALEPEVTA